MCRQKGGARSSIRLDRDPSALGPVVAVNRTSRAFLLPANLLTRVALAFSAPQLLLMRTAP